jgi:hypothetical protein
LHLKLRLTFAAPSMTSIKSLAHCLLLIACSYTCVSAQTTRERQEPTEPKKEVSTETSSVAANQEKPEITIVLAGGGEIVVEEVSEDADGYWYKRGNISTFIDRVKVQHIKRTSELIAQAAKTPVPGNVRWRLTDAAKVKDFFLATFNRPLPLSSFGQSDIHNRWGLDHRNGMDVNLHPDSPEGRALVVFLRAESIPFLTFRSAIPGVATGPHIHVGNPSPRVSIH